MFKSVLKKIVFFYEVVLAPYCLSFLYWPIYKIFKRFDVVFIVNIANGVGHIFAETDNYLRFKSLNPSLENKKFIWIAKPTPLTLGMKTLYSHHFYKVFCSHFLYLAMLPLTSRYKKITLDCGISRMKWQVGSYKSKGLFPHAILQRLPKFEGIKQTCEYYKRCANTADFFPLKDLYFDEKVINTKKKIALISLKDISRNASAKATNPKTLLESMSYLIELGFFLVFVGREVMPECFKKFNVYNYANSGKATFRNDILLFNQAEIAITSGSGISFLADRLDKRFLYVNSWHLQMNMPSEKCVIVPTLIKKKCDQKYLKFSEQIELYDTKCSENFQYDEFEAINATSGEIFFGLKELLSKRMDLTDLQLRYKSLGGKFSPLKYGKSICSHDFLVKHIDLLK